MIETHYSPDTPEQVDSDLEDLKKINTNFDRENRAKRDAVKAREAQIEWLDRPEFTKKFDEKHQPTFMNEEWGQRIKDIAALKNEAAELIKTTSQVAQPDKWGGLFRNARAIEVKNVPEWAKNLRGNEPYQEVEVHVFEARSDKIKNPEEPFIPRELHIDFRRTGDQGAGDTLSIKYILGQDNDITSYEITRKAETKHRFPEQQGDIVPSPGADVAKRHVRVSPQMVQESRSITMVDHFSTQDIQHDGVTFNGPVQKMVASEITRTPKGISAASSEEKYIKWLKINKITFEGAQGDFIEQNLDRKENEVQDFSDPISAAASLEDWVTLDDSLFRTAA